MKINRRLATVNSALWAAYGDALGFMTELADAKGVVWRTGHDYIERTSPWRRRIGGRFGAVLDLPTGCYSDDTQLRLAVARSISTNGQFDAEVFAKIELTVWQAYALGGGRGTKLAAANLARRDVNWFSNFYKEGSSYFGSGGNGAAMRIQPHVWAASDLNDREAIATAILRDAVCTHGHPRALAGAVLHGWWLAYGLSTGEPPSPEQWLKDINLLPNIESWLCSDEMLATFWLSTWNQHHQIGLREALLQVCDELRRDIDALFSVSFIETDYRTILDKLGGFDPEQVGSGTKTALVSSALAWRHRSNGPNVAILEAANAFGSDTDTIATMVGALLGACTSEPPSGVIQDSGYIAESADRMYHIAQGDYVQPFTYPDPGSWSPPKALLDLVTQQDEQMVVAGLGGAVAASKPIMDGTKNDNVWQWLKLNFGQTLLIKRRQQMSSNARKPITSSSPQVAESGVIADIFENHSRNNECSVDQKTQAAIYSGFDQNLIGRHLLEFASVPDGIEKAIAYAAIIIKAKSSRLKKEGK